MGIVAFKDGDLPGVHLRQMLCQSIHIRLQAASHRVGAQIQAAPDQGVYVYHPVGQEMSDGGLPRPRGAGQGDMHISAESPCRRPGTARSLPGFPLSPGRDALPPPEWAAITDDDPPLQESLDKCLRGLLGFQVEEVALRGMRLDLFLQALAFHSDLVH